MHKLKTMSTIGTVIGIIGFVGSIIMLAEDTATAILGGLVYAFMFWFSIEVSGALKDSEKNQWLARHERKTKQDEEEKEQ